MNSNEESGIKEKLLSLSAEVSKIDNALSGYKHGCDSKVAGPLASLSALHDQIQNETLSKYSWPFLLFPLIFHLTNCSYAN